MCGIVGVIGKENAASILYAGLQQLEYRGYDSAGICIAAADGLKLRRSVGKLAELGKLLEQSPLQGSWGIGHTRWATHGGVVEENAHPLLSGERVAVVHNGIIENHKQLRRQLEAEGYSFTSSTDTEVLAHLFAAEMKNPQHRGDLPAITCAVLARIEGAYAFAVMLADFPDTIIAARNASPLAVGIGEGSNYIGSDSIALSSVTRDVIFLKDGDFAVLTVDDAQIFDTEGKPAQRELVRVAASPGVISKAGYRHYMEKEIAEQPEAITHTLSGLLDIEGMPRLELGLDPEALDGLLLLAAGTSHNAAMIGKYWIEDIARLPVLTELASEFRYRNPAVSHLSAAIGISQSGESLDTLMALRHAAEQGLVTAGLVNVPQSTIAREADHVLETRAGPEIGVASTKAFTAQLTVLLALAIDLGLSRRVLQRERALQLVGLLHSLPRLVGLALDCFDELRPVARRLAKAHSCLYLGRGPLYPLALEGALKLKELSYIHAEGYASGEMKHGPIALIERGLPVVAMLAADHHREKALSNLMEARARGADIIILASDNATEDLEDMDTVITMPACDPLLAPILLSVPAQILAYLTAAEKGTDVDQPRNLAKSVTVE